MDQASYVFPAGEPGRLNLQASSQLVTMLNWAMSPHVKRLNMAFVLVDEKLADLSDRLTGNPHVATIEVPLPDEPDARGVHRRRRRRPRRSRTSPTSTPRELAKLTAGISLTDLNVLDSVGARERQAARRDGVPRAEEAAARAAVPRPARVHRAAGGRSTPSSATRRPRRGCARTRRCSKRGALDSLPMGYLLCGPVGTGKSFLAQCVSGEIGVPCVMLKNFRSKYVGETEGNLERVLSVLRAMGPVVVVVDEADAALGSREQDGDSGTSSRVFAMIAAQMGDTRVPRPHHLDAADRAPDLLPIDLKRQGRAEVHIPLFYPTDESEIRQMFVILAKKLGSRVAPEDVPAIPQRGQLSGADIEGMVGRAWRTSLLAGADHVTREALAEVVAQFMPSTQGLERELQETAAMLECTDRQFLPPAILEKMAAEGGRAQAAGAADGAQADREGICETGRQDPMARTSWFDDKAEHPADSGTGREAGVVHERAGRRRRVEAGAERPGAAAGGGDEDARGRAERRAAREGDDRARRADAYNVMRLLHELQAQHARMAFSGA